MKFDDVIQAVEAARGDPGKLALATTDILLVCRGQDLRVALEAASIPHWFDAQILGALLDLSPEAAGSTLDALCSLAMVESYERRQGWNVHEATRLAVRARLAREDKQRFCCLSAVAAECLAGEEPHQQVEAIYHRLCAAPDDAADELRRLSKDWRDRGRIEPLQTLAIVLEELIHSDYMAPRALGRAQLCFSWIRAPRLPFSQQHEVVEQALRLFSDLGEEPGTAEAHHRLGWVLQHEGRLSDALTQFQAAKAIWKLLAGREPDNTERLRDLSVSYTDIGAVLQAQGKLAEALAESRASEAIREQLAQLDPDEDMGRRMRRDDKVIHVVFGPRGGRVTARRERRAPNELEQRAVSREPVTDLFTSGEIARLLGATTTRLRTLDRAGISPTARKKGRRAYSFADLIALRTALGLLDQKVPLRDVTRAVDALTRSLLRVARPLVELRIVSDGRRVVVHNSDRPFETLTGRVLLDLEVKALRDDVVRVLRPSAGRERSRTAYGLYLQASRLDEDSATVGEAERLYRRAIELDPWLAIAYTNLGNIYLRRRDSEGAEELYRKALEIDPRQPAAQYNLGYVMLDRGQPERSIPLFVGAIEADPGFSDAYFNLAMAYEQVGDTQRARPCWSNFIALEPSGSRTGIARSHL